MTDQKIRVMPWDQLLLEAHQKGWALDVIPGRGKNSGNYTRRQTAIDVANERVANGINHEQIISAEEDGTFTLLEISQREPGGGDGAPPPGEL